VAIVLCARSVGEHSSVWADFGSWKEREGMFSLRFEWEGEGQGAMELWEVSAVFCQRGMAGCLIKSLTTGMQLSMI
jgi:hypothetical protein